MHLKDSEKQIVFPIWRDALIICFVSFERRKDTKSLFGHIFTYNQVLST